MPLDEKLFWLCLGGVIGYLWGRYDRRRKKDLDTIKKELRVVTETLKEDHRRTPFVPRVALALVVLMTALAAFWSQRASNESAEAVQRMEERYAQESIILSCSREFIGKVAIALNERTTFTTEQTVKNVELQKNQARFLTVVLKQPPVSEEGRRNSLQAYFDALTDFVIVASKSTQKAENNAYPKKRELGECIETKEQDGTQSPNPDAQ